MWMQYLLNILGLLIIIEKIFYKLLNIHIQRFDNILYIFLFYIILIINIAIFTIIKNR